MVGCEAVRPMCTCAAAPPHSRQWSRHLVIASRLLHGRGPGLQRTRQQTAQEGGVTLAAGSRRMPRHTGLHSCNSGRRAPCHVCAPPLLGISWSLQVRSSSDDQPALHGSNCRAHAIRRSAAHTCNECATRCRWRVACRSKHHANPTQRRTPSGAGLTSAALHM
jgi:hypothetical protein